MIIVVSKILLPKNIRGITLAPFVIVKHKKDKANITLLNHERIHVEQQLELLIVPFYLWYILEFLIRLIIYKDKFKAYKNISFEREAYQFESNLEYLKTRKWFSFFKFL